MTDAASIFEDSAAFGRHMQEVRPWPDIVQIEITSVCNLRCVMCPVVCETRERAPEERVLSVRDLEAIREVFENAYEVELTGFGEIFTHPDLLEVLRFFRRTRCTINATTNGTLLTEDRARAIVEEDLMDLLCISMDAATPETMARIRVGARLDRIVENARRLQAIKKELGRERPRLHLSFITMAENLDELPAFLHLAGDLGAAEVIVQGLNEKDAARVRSTAADPEREARVYREAHRIARERGVVLEFWYQGNRPEAADLAPGTGALRRFQVTRRPDGDAPVVKDCPFPWDRVFIKSNLDVQICATLWEELVMGNLRRQSFREIWEGEAYRQARDRMRGTHPPEECIKCMTKHWRVALPEDRLADRIDFGDPYGAQLGLGLYPVERDPDGRGHRWTRRRTTFFLANTGKPVLELDIFFHPQAPPLAAAVRVAGQAVGVLDSRTHWRSPAAFALPEFPDRVLRVDLDFDREWRPHDHGLPGGFRPLAAMVYGARLVDLPDGIGDRAVAGGPGDGQFIEGWYPPEAHFGRPARWATREASVLLAGGGAYEIEWLALPGIPPRMVELLADGERVARFEARAAPGAHTVRFAIPARGTRWHVLRIVGDGVFSPAEEGASPDTRRLGLLVRAVRPAARRGRLARLLRRG